MFERLFEKTVGFPSLVLFKSRLDWHLPEDGVIVADGVFAQRNGQNGHFRFILTHFFLGKKKIKKNKKLVYSPFRSSYIWIINFVIKKGELKSTFFFLSHRKKQEIILFLSNILELQIKVM